MKLKYKITLILMIIAILFAAVNYCIQKFFILPAYDNIEKLESKKDLDLCKTFIDDEIEYIRLLGRDWAYWDDSYNFIQKKNRDNFIESSLPKTILEETKLDLIMFYTLDQKVYWGKINTLSSNSKKEIKDLDKLFRENNFIFNTPKPFDKQETAILCTSYGILLLSASPIVHSDNTGPTAGTLIMGKFISKQLIEKLNSKLDVTFNIYSLSKNDTNIPISQSTLDYLFTDKYKYIISNDKNTLTAYSLMESTFHDQSFLLSVKVPRNIFKKASRILTYSNIFIIIVGIILLLVMILLINHNITTPLTALSYYISKIKSTEDLSNRIPTLSKDSNEIKYLTEEFNNMLIRTQYLVESMEDIIQERTVEIKTARKDTVLRLAMAVDSRDSITGNHILRLTKYTKFLSQLLGLSEKECSDISLASTLHDIGKVSVSDSILKKEGKLTAEEFEIVKSHTLEGGKILSGSNTKLLEIAKEIALYHHERWDGKGYPKGLKKEDIPLSARITSITDVFDALLSKRSYKDAWSVNEVKQFIENNSGTMFDPDLTKIFLENFIDFLKIKDKYSS